MKMSRNNLRDLQSDTQRYLDVKHSKPNQSIPTVPKTVPCHDCIVELGIVEYTYIVIYSMANQVEIERSWGSIRSTVTVGCRRVEPSYPAGSPRHRVPVHRPWLLFGRLLRGLSAGRTGRGTELTVWRRGC